MKGWVAAGAGVVIVFFTLGLISDAFAPAPTGPAGSSYATTPNGAAAWAELLARGGHTVVSLRRSLDDAPPPSGTTLIILGAGGLSASAGNNLAAFVRTGGRLVIGGGEPPATLPPVLRNPPGWTSTGSIVARSVARVPEVAGVTRVLAAGRGAWTSGPGTPALAGARGPMLLVLDRGQGRLVLLADASPVENQLLASADNARLALDLAGPPSRPVLFAEELHGYGEATGLAAIPTRWWLAFAGLCLAWAAWALARGRRLGPAQRPAPPPAPPRAEYVDALARTLVRGRDRGQLERLVEEAEHRRRTERPHERSGSVT
jgi:hypothetical protein